MKLKTKLVIEYFHRFDEETKRVELDYPRDMSMWQGIGNSIDSAFQWTDGKTYFFKGKGFWKFDDLRMKVMHERPRPVSQYWMGCPKKEDHEEFDNWPTKQERIVSIPMSSAFRSLPHSLLSIFLSVSLLALIYSY